MSHTGNDERREAMYSEWENGMLLRSDRMPQWWHNPALKSQEFEVWYEQRNGGEPC